MRTWTDTFLPLAPSPIDNPLSIAHEGGKSTGMLLLSADLESCNRRVARRPRCIFSAFFWTPGISPAELLSYFLMALLIIHQFSLLELLLLHQLEKAR